MGWLVCLLAVVASGAAQAQFGRTAFSTFEDGFTEAAVVRGMAATPALCATIEGAVWAAPRGQDGECIRFWEAGDHAAPSRRALFFFSGDLLNGRWLTNADYVHQNLASLQRDADRIGARWGVRYIVVGRPGLYGSSGDHRQRRRAAESQLMSAAIDEIKRRRGIDEIGIVGQSGGGHVVASLLGLRSDVVCAVPSSAASAPALRVAQKGWLRDSTGYADSYEPNDHLDKSMLNPALRVFVLGDPTDANVPFTTQTVLADRLHSLGATAEVLQGHGTGSQHHGLSGSAQRIGAMCLRDEPTQKILDVAAEGLRG